ncbi:MAG: twin-arginine translocase TatA/TatE family subunit [Chloroflexota bacterium]|nr:twin-arginine translocase TatA/TatE family subunit [Chloroflexota bacterium]MDQ3514546.1 twin-arginine translocase TatA/TatE family subunit [Chloroflexota bacterium]
MNVFGIGTGEIMIIVVVILVFFGPSKLPEVAGQVGRWVRDFRKMSDDLTGEFSKSLNEAGAGELRRTLDRDLKGMRSQVESVGRSVERDLGGGKKFGSASKTAAKSGTATTRAAGKSASSATAKALGTGTAKAGGTTTAAKASTTKAVKATVPAAPKASKADPLADLIELDFTAPAPVRPVPRSARRTDERDDDPILTSAIVVPPPTGDDSALARARQRRAAAPYNRARA